MADSNRNAYSSYGLKPQHLRKLLRKAKHELDGLNLNGALKNTRELIAAIENKKE